MNASITSVIALTRFSRDCEVDVRGEFRKQLTTVYESETAVNRSGSRWQVLVRLFMNSGRPYQAFAHIITMSVYYVMHTSPISDKRRRQTFGFLDMVRSGYPRFRVSTLWVNPDPGLTHYPRTQPAFITIRVNGSKRPNCRYVSKAISNSSPKVHKAEARGGVNLGTLFLPGTRCTSSPQRTPEGGGIELPEWIGTHRPACPAS